MKRTLIFAILFTFSTITSVAHAQLGFMEDATYPELVSNGRALAMGNAFIAKVDDASAAFYNPAGLGTVRYPHFHLSNFHIELNKDWLGLTTGGSLSDSFGNFFDGFSLEGQRKLLVENPGNAGHSRFSIMPNFTTRFFSVGYMISKQMKTRIQQAPGSQFEYADRTDHGPYAALNISLFGGVFKLGVSAIYLQRKEKKGAQDQTLSADFEDGEYQKGAAVILTGGAKLTLPVALLPTFAVVLRNAADQDFSSGRAAGTPDKIKQSVDVGFSITPQVGKVIRTHFEINYKDATGAHNVSNKRKLMAGMEIDIARTFFFRLGYGDGFGSAGIGVKSRRLEFDLTTYAVDTTLTEIRGKEDRRFAMTLSSGF